MHGITSDTLRRHFDGAQARAPRVTTWVWNHRWWLGVVLLPTLIATLYYAVFAANQYESEAHFIVRSVSQPSSPMTGLGAALSLVGGSGATNSDALSVGDYLNSHDAVAALQKRLDLVSMFRRPEADVLSRLLVSHPTPEKLFDFYKNKVDVTHETETGLMIVKVKSFRAADSYAIINAMLDLGEQRVNQLNERAYKSSLASAQRSVAEAEAGVTRAQQAVTAYRQGRRNIDPKATGAAQVSLVTGLQARLSQARAQLATLSATLAPNSPQVEVARQQVAALAAQVGAQEGRLTGGSNTIAAVAGGYEELMLRKDFAEKRYEAAAASLEKAREQARQQQLFLVRVVEPNMPVKSTYPKAFKTIATIFFALVLAYAIGWLIIAGMREHAA
ncbi:lipopolysaccharide biosynthesis protein [Sphingomonas quercus]|uniref:Lipopolysaccharide biosynthesis protein n=1 Tax=Sphingomonas quercus TaxID=2842451 RepID=A0ABS6BIV2_9SPHN|nr:lipopolysaccharide biosynthesis protein [Sphingomonas quercus]MBU3077154.1 lipopolysaccharide biosynthesis protein [Sphingomonas quercus]